MCPWGKIKTMKLHLWLQENQKTATWLASQTGLSVSHITRLLERNGAAEKYPSLEAAAKIALATGGAVTANDFTPPVRKKKTIRSEFAAA